MRVCPKCNTPYPDATDSCAKDGTALTTLLELIEERPLALARSLSGEVIGNYRIGKRIGAGGMGTVYRGTHLSIGKDFAVKILREDSAENPTLLDRFLQEARAVARIGHENVVQITDFGCTPEGRTYLVMELLVGQSLEDLLQKEKRLSPARALHIAAQICDALEAAHQQKIIHRDLKPDNIFLIQSRGDPDFVKVLDFGIAKQLEDTRNNGLTMTRQLVGTPMYMAPEQGTAADHRTDIYSLGVTLYRMVTGRLPFEGANMMDVLYKHISEPPKPPRELDPSLSLGLNNAILTALAKEPAKRFQSMEGFGNALRSMQTTSAPALTPSHRSQELPNQPRPQTTLGARGEVIPPEPRPAPPRALILGAVAATLLGAVTVFALWGGGSAPASSAAPQDVIPAEPAAPVLAPTQAPEPVPASVPASAPAPEAIPATDAPSPSKTEGETPKNDSPQSGAPKDNAPKTDQPKAGEPNTDAPKSPKDAKSKKVPPKGLTEGNPEL